MEQLRELAAALLERAGHDAQELRRRDAKIDKLTFEIAQLKRMRYGVKSEHFDPGQKLLFDEDIDADMYARGKTVLIADGLEPTMVSTYEIGGRFGRDQTYLAPQAQG